MAIMRWLLGASLAVALPLAAEVEQIVVTWTAQLCEHGCQASLYKYFQAIRGVADVDINGPNGTATLRWKPNQRFSYAPIDAAMRMVGPSIRDIRVKVRGTINRRGRSFSILSLGDNTSFELLGIPLPHMRNDTAIENSLYTREMDPQRFNQLQAAQQAADTVVIEGPLFEPWRSPTLRLVVQSMTVVSSAPQR